MLATPILNNENEVDLSRTPARNQEMYELLRACRRHLSIRCENPSGRLDYRKSWPSHVHSERRHDQPSQPPGSDEEFVHAFCTRLVCIHACDAATLKESVSTVWDGLYTILWMCSPVHMHQETPSSMDIEMRLCSRPTSPFYENQKILLQYWFASWECWSFTLLDWQYSNSHKLEAH